MECRQLVDHLDTYLRIHEIKDYSCNGLQIQGPENIEKIALAVDFCSESAMKAREIGAQMLMVHHGLIWGGLTSIRDITFERVRYLICNNIGLYAAHLPLDLHPSIGNNAELARMLELEYGGPFGSRDGLAIGLWGELKEPVEIEKLQKFIDESLSTRSTILPFGKKQVKRIAIVSGGAAWAIEEAIQRGCDAYLTGEPSHSVFHTAMEGAVNIIYAGHYASETLGIKALGRYIENSFSIPTHFIDIPTGF